MIGLPHTIVTEHHAQLPDSDMDVSALLPHRKNMFAGHFAETEQLDKKQGLFSEYLSVLSGDVVTLTSTMVDDITGIREGGQVRVFVNTIPDRQDPTIDIAEKTNSDRVELLARKYAEKENFSKEDSARFAIVTERIRQLLPTVTAEDYESLEHVLKTIREIDSEDVVTREKLGLPHKKN